MAQIIRHHEHPAGYDYANMLNDYRDFGGIPTAAQVDAVAELMSDAGVEVDMQYGCGNSGVFVNVYCGEVTDAYTNFFNYTQALGCLGLSNLAHSIIRSEIDNNRPVIFSGLQGFGGHAWVGDGYIKGTRCYTGTDYQGNTILYLQHTKMYHMNWGWHGDVNGWFDYSTWGGMFNTDQEVIHHIIPEL